MEENNLLAEVKVRSVIRVERNMWSGKRVTDTTLCFTEILLKKKATKPFQVLIPINWGLVQYQLQERNRAQPQ